jgi:hypothetical protein
MVKLTLASSLCGLVDGVDSARSVAIAADCWPEAVDEIRACHPRLAARVLHDDGHLRQGFLVAVNGVMKTTGDLAVEVGPGDEVFLFVQIAGG